MRHSVTVTGLQKVLTRILALPTPVIRLLAGPAPQIDGRTLDAPIGLILAFERWGLAGSTALDVAQRRRELSETAGLVMPRVESLEVRDSSIPGPGGDLRVRIYRNDPSERPLPVIVFYHGGGWVIGDLDSHDGSCRMLALHSGCVVVSVEYRLAPEHPFPAPLDDALAAFRYVNEHVDQFGGLPGAVAVMGDSAGGNMAASVSLATRGNGPAPVAQCLVYPAVDARMTSPSADTFATGFFLTKQDMFWFRDHYLPDPAAHTDPRVSPLLAEDLSGLPPAAIWTAGFDPLRDEGEAYAERLREAGVPVRYECVDGQIHGFFGIGVTPSGMATIAAVSRQAGAWIRRAVEASGAQTVQR